MPRLVLSQQPLLSLAQPVNSYLLHEDAAGHSRLSVLGGIPGENRLACGIAARGRREVEGRLVIFTQNFNVRAVGSNCKPTWR